MGVGMTLSGHDPEPRGTEVFPNRRDHFKVSDWMQSLPRGKYPAVDAFADEGVYEGTDVLARQMEEAFRDHPPPAEAVAHVDHLLDLIGGGYPGETIEMDY